MLGICLPPWKNQGMESSPFPPKISFSLRSGGSFGGSAAPLPFASRGTSFAPTPTSSHFLCSRL